MSRESWLELGLKDHVNLYDTWRLRQKSTGQSEGTKPVRSGAPRRSREHTNGRGCEKRDKTVLPPREHTTSLEMPIDDPSLPRSSQPRTMQFAVAGESRDRLGGDDER